MKEKIFIEGGKRLSGSIPISGAKNSCLTLMPASLLSEGALTLKNVPDLADTRLMIKLINALGVMTKFYDGVIDFHGEPQNIEAPKELVSKMRASICLLYTSPSPRD